MKNNDLQNQVRRIVGSRWCIDYLPRHKIESKQHIDQSDSIAGNMDQIERLFAAVVVVLVVMIKILLLEECLEFDFELVEFLWLEFKCTLYFPEYKILAGKINKLPCFLNNISDHNNTHHLLEDMEIGKKGKIHSGIFEDSWEFKFFGFT